jgi:hydroxyethylthiazole kinase
MIEKINRIRQHILEERPLILNITNAVTADFVANGLLSMGASPVMSHALCEIEELVALSSAVMVNIGTLSDNFNQLAKKTCRIANNLKKPIILDPVGAGATHYRTSVCKQLLSETNIAIIRGNAGEVMALAGQMSHTKGVDSLIGTAFAVESAQMLARYHGIVVAMSGETDVITDGTRIEKITRGSELMPLITGTGCLLTAVVAAFHAVCEDAFDAAAYASYFYAVSGERAARDTSLPGSFKVHFLDALHALII